MFNGVREVDDVERWLANEVDSPGLDAIERVVQGQRLSRTHWRSLIRFVAVQSVRTPQAFFSAMTFAQDNLPRLLDGVVRDLVDETQRARSEGRRPSPPPGVDNPYSELLSIELQKPMGSDHHKVVATLALGRRLWIASMRNIAKGPTEVLCAHRWSIATPHGDHEWPLTDHPSLRINFRSPTDYDFRGGWGNPGSEVMMPVSPRHLMYVQVGKKSANRILLSEHATKLTQRLMVEGAHRLVLATRPQPWVGDVRPRVVDPRAFHEDREHWKTFNERNRAVEEGLEKRRSGA